MDPIVTKLVQEGLLDADSAAQVDRAAASGMPLDDAMRSAKGVAEDKVLRFLDCAVIKFSLDKLAELDTVYHTVRGVFVEGGEAFPGAGIRLKSHVQVAIREPRCILGFFRPSPGSYAED